MYLTAVFVIFVIWCLVKFFEWKRRVYDPVKKLPGFGYPIIGWFHKVIGLPKKDHFKIMNEINCKYGPVYRHWSVLTPQIHIFKPECIETILNNTVNMDKGYIYNIFHPWLGTGSLFLSPAYRWHHIRKQTTPAFDFKSLQNYMETFTENAETLLRLLDGKADGTPFDIFPDMSHCALDILCETAMGVKVNAMSKEDNEYITAIHDISESIIWRILRPFINDFMYKFCPQRRTQQKIIRTLHKFTNQVIADRKVFLKNNPKEMSQENLSDDIKDEVLGEKKRTSFLDMLLKLSEDGKFISDDNIREQVDAVMFGGHDTTTSNLSWTLFLLGNYPEVQEKTYKEVHEILRDKTTPTSISELNDLQYLDCVIKESLRIYPSVPFIMRNLSEVTEIEGCKVPAGTPVVIEIYQVQHSPEYFPNPEVFIPERFFPENCVKRHPFSYLPFSAGPRICLGQKFSVYGEKTILASIINRYKISAMESQKDVILIPDLVLRPMNGITVSLQRRK